MYMIKMVTLISKTILTIIVCTTGSSPDSLDQFGKNKVYHPGHRAICLVMLIELHTVSERGAVLPAAQHNSSQNHGDLLLGHSTVQYNQSPVTQRPCQKLPFLRHFVSGGL